MYIIVSTAPDGSIHHYGMWSNSEAARRWGLAYHGASPQLGKWQIIEVNRVA